MKANPRYKAKFPKLSFKERMQLLGYARYMGYEFDYNAEKKKAILIKTNGKKRKVLYLAKISHTIIGVDANGNKESLNDQMHITKMLHEKGIFRIPEDMSMGINDYIRENLSIIAP
jgi:hypothetical protein